MKRSIRLKSAPCRPDDRFVAYVMGELDRKDGQDLERHTRQCPECRLRLGAFRSAGLALERMFSRRPRRRDVAPAEKLIQAVLAQLPEQQLYYNTATFDRFGSILAAATDRGLCFVSFRPDAEEEYLEQWAEADFTVSRTRTALQETFRQLREYFGGKRERFDLPVDLRFASDFTRRVLEETTRVEYGHLRTYQEIANRIRRPRAVRAVGNALGRNPVPIVVPCHRVVATGGGLGGFTGGLEYKRKLLAVEGIETGGGDLFAQ